jgi:hypothetical protein
VPFSPGPSIAKTWCAYLLTAEMSAAWSPQVGVGFLRKGRFLKMHLIQLGSFSIKTVCVVHT